MIRKYYALPQLEKDCNAVHLLLLDLVSGTAEMQPGLATLEGGETVELFPGFDVLQGAAVVAETFTADLDVRARPIGVEDETHWLAWLATYKGHNPADSEPQRVASALLLYLWLQRGGLLAPL